MSDVKILDIFQVPKHGTSFGRGFISSFTFSFGEDKALDPFVFSFHSSSAEVTELYIITEKKVQL